MRAGLAQPAVRVVLGVFSGLSRRLTNREQTPVVSRPRSAARCWPRSVEFALGGRSQGVFDTRLDAKGQGTGLGGGHGFPL